VNGAAGLGNRQRTASYKKPGVRGFARIIFFIFLFVPSALQYWTSVVLTLCIPSVTLNSINTEKKDDAKMTSTLHPTTLSESSPRFFIFCSPLLFSVESVLAGAHLLNLSEIRLERRATLTKRV
jgi:hypothetical protein